MWTWPGNSILGGGGTRSHNNNRGNDHKAREAVWIPIERTRPQPNNYEREASTLSPQSPVLFVLQRMTKELLLVNVRADNNDGGARDGRRRPWPVPFSHVPGEF